MMNNNRGRYPPGIGAGRGAINPNPNFQSRPGYQQQPPPQYVQRGGYTAQQNHQQQFQQATSQQQWLRRPQISGGNSNGDAVAEVEKSVLSQAIDTKLVALSSF
ncbi:hypothetical protein F2Q70_00000042 [Brassica cretica]|uniref:Uncharacterized protein n=1 Tax=Brassica cretica TaxID=69181 RepID=A0A8S9J2Q7_BRACR|nr:hypothetical protein F2Q70_00000042 [Brassica cretica]